MSSQLESIYSDELILLAETLGEVKTRTEKLEGEFSTHAKPLEAATNALSAALSGIKALQFHVLDNNLGALSARVEEMRKAVDEQVGVIALELKKADETNAAKAGAEAEALRSEIVALQSQLGSLVTQFGQQLERVEFAAKEEARKLQLIPGPAGAAGASLNPRGTFIDGETYNRLDVVSWLGSSYIATVDGVTEKPSKNSNQWQTLASRGGGGAGGVGDFGSLAGVAQINQGGTGQTTRAAALNALLPDQAGATQYILLTDGSGTVSWGAQPVAGLPSQTSNSGRLLTTNGTTASWSNAVTVSGSNATVTGTLTVNGVATAGSYLTSAAGLAFPGALSASGYYLYSGSANGLTMYGYGSTYDVYIGNRAGTRALSVAANSTVVSIPDTTASTTTSTGALVVSGGLGVGGAVNIGGTLTANGTTFNLSTASANGSFINMDGLAGNFKIITTRTGGVDRWYFGQDTAAESGSNAGSPFFIRALTDAGAVIDTPLTITRAAGGRLTTPRPVTISDSTASTSTSSGALVVSGGVGVAGAINGGGNLLVSGTGKIGAVTAADSRFHVYESSAVDVGNGVTIEQAGTGDAVTAFLLSGVQRWSVGIDNSDSDKFKIGTGALGSADRLTIDTSGNTTIAGTLQVGNAYVAGDPVTTGYIVIKDSTGTSYKIPAVAL